MTVIATLWQYRDELIQSFHLATIHGMIGTWRRCESLMTKPQEPDFIAGLVIDSTPLIYSSLKTILSSRRVSVSMSAVFCHQTPQVTFNPHSPISCELGDILFAYVHTPKFGVPRRNAILFQAKASAKQPYRIRSGEKGQLHLYEDWPDFVYERSSFLNGQKRSVTPKAPHSGAQYLLIDDRPPEEPMSGLLGFPGTYPVGCCIPDETLRDHTHLASELFSLFIFRSGRPFDDKHSAAKNKDWSQVVWDLLETGMKKLFNRKNSGRRRIPRGGGDTIQMMDGLSFNRASSPLAWDTATEILGRNAARFIYGVDDDIPTNNRDRSGDPEGPESGVSVVLIETSERESES
jgi:hypothetical protein